MFQLKTDVIQSMEDEYNWAQYFIQAIIHLGGPANIDLQYHSNKKVFEWKLADAGLFRDSSKDVTVSAPGEWIITVGRDWAPITLMTKEDLATVQKYVRV